jgi:hypothetical protein
MGLLALHGVVEIELAARIIIATPDGGVEIKFVPTGRLRCSPAAAEGLRQSIEIAIKNGSASAATSPCGGVQIELGPSAAPLASYSRQHAHDGFRFAGGM